ncbi:hypothetical protein [Peribacillus simplex]|uniref:hypothetical protein n=1 Tax=Peribacillus simplex TaxID=1478 RepID=UPI00333C93EC
MRKIFFLMTILCSSYLFTQHSFAQSATHPNISVNVMSPESIKEYPGFEMRIKAQVINNTNQSISDVMAYITMANTIKHWTVNLEDYSADEPIYIGTLKPNEIKTVQLPIRFVYKDQYKLYVTASSDREKEVYSSSSIPVDILGNTKINPLIVEVVAIAIPLMLLIWLLTLSYRMRKNRNI